MRRPLLCGIVLALVASTGGCSSVGLGGGGRTVTAYFTKTPALYEKSLVKVMGANVGRIDDISVDGTRVRVRMSVDSGVPLPPDVHAAIVPVNTVGERNIVLYPPWRSGQPRAAGDLVIQQDRTELPVEVDEALTAFTKLSAALNPGQVRDLVHRTAVASEGLGPSFNKTLQSTATVTHNLAAQDQKIIEVAEGLRKIARGIGKREGQLGQTIGAFQSTNSLLAGERTEVTGLLTALVLLAQRGDVLIKTLKQSLPSTLADASELVMTLKANSASLTELIVGIAKFTDGTFAIWDRRNHMITLRLVLSHTVRAWLKPIFDSMGWGRVPCVPDKNLANCTKPPGSGG